jgi:hypothetical protein
MRARSAHHRAMVPQVFQLSEAGGSRRWRRLVHYGLQASIQYMTVRGRDYYTNGTEKP